MSDHRYLRRVPDDAEYFFREGCWILEQLNDDADPQASIARARVTPGVSTRPHRLIDTTERYVILAGRGLAQVGNEPEFPVRPGDVVLIPPGVVQSISNDGDTDLVFLAVCTPRFRPENYRED